MAVPSLDSPMSNHWVLQFRFLSLTALSDQHMNDQSDKENQHNQQEDNNNDSYKDDSSYWITFDFHSKGGVRKIKMEI